MPGRGWGELLSRFLLVIGSALFTVSIIEICLRVVYLPNPFATQNFTVDPVNQQLTELSIRYDDLLGYIPRPERISVYKDWPIQFSAGQLGVRLNRTPKDGTFPSIPKGGVLAVGDSFTWGSEVADWETWPAYLEAETGIPVVNAGVGGYGIDQAVLRAEQLIPVVNPSVIVVSFIPNCIGRNEYYVHGKGLEKPYFDLIKGELRIRNVPVPIYQPSRQFIGWTRLLLGRSYAALWTADRIGLRDKWQVFEPEVGRAHENGLGVTCALWKRLAAAAGKNTKLVVLAQYAGYQVTGEDNSREHFHVSAALTCASEVGFIVVDSYPALIKILARGEGQFWPLWVREKTDTYRHTGHMSALGNKFTAELLKPIVESGAQIVSTKNASH
jgi:hypothetical protein